MQRLYPNDMTVREINNELDAILNSNSPDCDRFEQLMEQKEVLEGNITTFHFVQDMTIGQVQIAAKEIRAVIEDEPLSNNHCFVNCPIPLEANGKWDNLKALVLRSNFQFFVQTPQFDKLLYKLKSNSQITGIETNIYTELAQRKFKMLTSNDSPITSEDIDDLIEDFVFINTSLTCFFTSEAHEADSYDLDEKYSPCFFDRERFFRFKTEMNDFFGFCVDNKKLQLCRRYMLKDFAMLIKYLTFWVCLVDVATFPGLKEEFRNVYNKLISYLIKNFANIRIYDIITETADVKNGVNTNKRGSESNTTRVKIFFAEEDDKPQILRLDLPHVEHPYVHINIGGFEENNEKGENHFRLSSDEKESGEYDAVFNDLVTTLLTNNYNGITIRNTPPDDDQKVLHEMKYWSAMYNYVVAAKYYLSHIDSRLCNNSTINNAKKALLNLLSDDGIKTDEAATLNPYELFEFADMSIREHHLLP